MEPEKERVDWLFLVLVPAFVALIIIAGFLYFQIYPRQESGEILNQKPVDDSRPLRWRQLMTFKAKDDFLRRVPDKVFDQTFSTVSATSSTDDPNWVLYRNEEYGFEVEIPISWDIIKEFETAEWVDGDEIPAGSFEVRFAGSPNDSALVIVVTKEDLDDQVFKLYGRLGYVGSSQEIKANGYRYFIVGQTSGQVFDSLQTFDLK